MKKYTIEKKYYHDNSIDVYTDRTEWEKAIDQESNRENTRGTGDTMTIAIYEAPEDSNVEKGESWTITGEKFKKQNVNYARIPENWELVEEQQVGYWHIQEVWARQDGDYLTYLCQIDDEPEPDAGKIVRAWMDDSEIYTTEEEAMSNNNPSQYLTI